MSGIEIKIAEVSLSGGITVKVSNASKDVIKVWQESNSWGGARWRVLRIRKGLLETFFQNPNERFTKNIPTFTQIAAGAQIGTESRSECGKLVRLRPFLVQRTRLRRARS
ncbi:MAG: hypothetical protein P4M04_07160 [Acidobacteriota bacterium]|nr:hypothetical protein [Acidobacteriota bacterium]